jgi:transposase InsO family protein
LRVDTVPQGDTENAKGVSHIHAVDEVTQWEIAASVERISEAYQEPVLAAMLTQFPFVIRRFHSDNGSEFINQTVAKLLNKLMIQQRKSRPRHSNDNGLAETKNGAIIRKPMGRGHIPASHAERIQQFYSAYLNPCLNLRPPCGQADIEGMRRTKTPSLPPLSNSAGDTFVTAPCSAVPTSRTHARDSEAHQQSNERYRSRATNAKGQAAAL